MAHTPYRNVLDCARKMAQAEGISAFYKSYRTTLVRGEKGGQFATQPLVMRGGVTITPLKPLSSFRPVTLLGSSCNAVTPLSPPPADQDCALSGH